MTHPTGNAGRIGGRSTGGSPSRARHSLAAAGYSEHIHPRLQARVDVLGASVTSNVPRPNALYYAWSYDPADGDPWQPGAVVYATTRLRHRLDNGFVDITATASWRSLAHVILSFG